MRILAWITIGIGVAVQLFFDLSPLMLPSMASAEGVAVYPAVSESILRLTYGCLPYAVFGAGVVMIERRFSNWSSAAQLGVVAGVFSPFAFMVLAAVTRFPVSQFRQGFWPIRPVVQIAVFVIVLLGSQLICGRSTPRSAA